MTPYSHGFEDSIGQKCENDDDCHHSSYNDRTFSTRAEGGKCNLQTGKCTCTACAAGDDCKVIKQWQAGKWSGARLVLSVPSDQILAVYSALNSRWASGAAVFLHSRLNNSNVACYLCRTKA